MLKAAFIVFFYLIWSLMAVTAIVSKNNWAVAGIATVSLLAIIFLVRSLANVGVMEANKTGERGLTLRDMKSMDVATLAQLMNDMATASGMRIVAKDEMKTSNNNLAGNTLKTTTYEVRKL